MTKTKTIIGILAIIIFIGGAIVIATHNDNDQDAIVPVTETRNTEVPGPALHDPSTLKPGSTGTATGSTAPAANAYTMAQVAIHNSAASCWTVIRSGVFDLTAWISQHPGGQQAILSICGIDGTSTFDAQHEGQGRPEQVLASFKIGILK